jgi:dihydrofolate reductase
MGKLVVSEFVTLDGVMEDPGGGETFEHGGWAFQVERGADGDKAKFDELMSADVLLLGRVTFQAFAQAWPGRTDDVGYADKFNNMRKYVVSTTLNDPGWNNSTVIREDVAGEIARLKAQTSGDILVMGSAQLVQTLREHDLVDEYSLMVFPIVVGSGKRLFNEGSHTTPLRLASSQPVGSDGVVILTYVPAAPKNGE